MKFLLKQYQVLLHQVIRFVDAEKCTTEVFITILYVHTLENSVAMTCIVVSIPLDKIAMDPDMLPGMQKQGMWAHKNLSFFFSNFHDSKHFVLITYGNEICYSY